MTTALTAPAMDPDTRRLMDAVVKDLVAAQRTGSRDMGPDVRLSTPGPAPAQPSADDEAQRFFGGVLQAVVQHVIPAVAPTILNLLQQRRRELGLPEQRDAQGLERDFGSILQALLPKLLDAVPTLVQAFAGKPAPRSTEEQSQRFLPFLGALIPAVVSAVPGIIAAFNQQRGADATPPPIHDPAVAQRFLGPLLTQCIPQLVQAAPSILSSIFGGGREIQSSSTW